MYGEMGNLGGVAVEAELDEGRDPAMHRHSHMLGWGAWVPKAGSDPMSAEGQPTGLGRAATEDPSADDGGLKNKQIVVTLLPRK